MRKQNLSWSYSVTTEITLRVLPYCGATNILQVLLETSAGVRGNYSNDWKGIQNFNLSKVIHILSGVQQVEPRKILKRSDCSERKALFDSMRIRRSGDYISKSFSFYTVRI